MRGLSVALALAATLSGQQESTQPARDGEVPWRPCDSVVADRLAESARHPAIGTLEAARQLQEAHRACPDRAAFLVEAAVRLAEGRQYSESLRIVEQILADSPGSIDALVVKANNELMAQRFQDALDTASGILSRQGDHATAMKLKGNATYFLGDAEQAEETFLRLLDKHPRDSEASYMLGRIYYQEGRIAHAAAQFQRVLKLDPTSYKAYDNLGLCYEALGETDKAVQNYLAAIQLVETAHPDYDWPYANLASLLINLGDPARGYDAAFTAAKRNPRSSRNFFLGGKALMMLGRNEEALRWLERSTVMDPTDSRPWYLLSQLHQRLGDEESAERAASEFLRAKSNEPDAPR